MSDFDSYYPDDEEELEKSKTQIKEEMLALQKLGERLCDLPEPQLLQVPLPDQLREAIMLARRLKHREGRRRQMQFIGKLMRTVDVEEIEGAFNKFEQKARAQTQRLHIIENWRDRLIEEGDDALAELCTELWNADRQMLRQLIRNAQKERSQQKAPAASRKLFKVLREAFETQNS